MLLQRHTVNLNWHAPGQLVNCDTGASRLVHEELFIGSIHFVEVGHVSEVYSQLDDLRKARPTGLQNGRNVPAADRSLLADTAFDQLP